MDGEATYICDFCGEEIIVSIDPSADSHQEYVEDFHILKQKYGKFAWRGHLGLLFFRADAELSLSLDVWEKG